MKLSKRQKKGSVTIELDDDARQMNQLRSLLKQNYKEQKRTGKGHM